MVNVKTGIDVPRRALILVRHAIFAAQLEPYRRAIKPSLRRPLRLRLKAGLYLTTGIAGMFASPLIATELLR
jgi:hypothetical protein